MRHTLFENVNECNQTRGDQIRAMSDEALAWVIMGFRVDAYGKAMGDEVTLPDTQVKIREWLSQKEKVIV